MAPSRPPHKPLRMTAQFRELEVARRCAIFDLAKTPAGHLADFGIELVELCRRHGIPQSVVAAALDVTPAVISRRYAAAVPIAE